ncbi:MAG: LapA family protein [Ilumatobacter sp.]|nr:MAG: LapA family protein [Ilumatobacter sp.]
MTDEGGTTGRSAGAIIKLVLWVVVLVALVVFAVSNRQKANVDWLFTETETALWVVIAISTVAGAVLGYITARRRA